jgi:sugar lactone lactonase YvrE
VFTFDHVRGVLDAQHGLLEAPTETADGIAFSDVMAGGVYLAGPDGTVTQLLERRRGIGGMALVRGGGLVVSGRDVSIVRDGALETVYADPESFGFNDLVALSDGSIVAGVFRYRPLHGDPPVPGEFVRLDPDGSSRTLIDDVVWPNGIAEAPDGHLFVSDYERRHVKRVDPRTGAAEVFHELADGNPDGLAVDAEGALWIAAGTAAALIRVGPDGGVDRIVDVPARFVSSLCFAGEDRVYVTTADNLVTPDTGGSLLTARTDVPGAPVAQAVLG